MATVRAKLEAAARDNKDLLSLHSNPASAKTAKAARNARSKEKKKQKKAMQAAAADPAQAKPSAVAQAAQRANPQSKGAPTPKAADKSVDKEKRQRLGNELCPQYLATDKCKRGDTCYRRHLTVNAFKQS